MKTDESSKKASMSFPQLFCQRTTPARVAGCALAGLSSHRLKACATSRRIVYIQYTNPAAYPPLEHSARILAERGWEALFLGAGALGAGSLRFSPADGIRVEQIRFQSPGWRQKLNYIYFHFWCLWKVLRWKPDWLYCSDVHSTPPGWLLSIAGKRVVYHEHDTPQAASGRAFERLLLWARASCARRARVCVIPNARRAESLGDAIVVWNCPRLEETAGRRKAIEPGTLRLLYHGSIVPERLPMSVIDALAAVVAGDISLTVAGYETAGSRGYVNRLRDRANKLGISGRLRIVGAVTQRDELLALCREHDAGLALMPLASADVNLRYMEGASNKPFDYLACGLALIVSRLPEWERMFVASGYGYSCDPASAPELARIFEDLSGHAARTRAMGEAGRQRILSEWNYENQFRPVLNVLESCGERLEDASCAMEARS